MVCILSDCAGIVSPLSLEFMIPRDKKPTIKAALAEASQTKESNERIKQNNAATGSC